MREELTLISRAMRAGVHYFMHALLAAYHLFALLHKAGANLNLRDAYRQTVMMRAVDYREW